MQLARVIGNVVCTIKNPSMEGLKLLVLQPITREGRDRGRPLVAVDSIGAGYGEVVYWCRGKEASLAFPRDVPTECTVIAIVDRIETPEKSIKYL
ncbi:MAG: EutN/CcmL family microcompartment protein [Acidobacteriia bacterium]|nr:EutN/CcmL family microcompartment protein [Terriglobia bacterium]